MTLETILIDLASRGWRVNQIYQFDNSTWRVNLRARGAGGDWFGDFAEAPTLLEAIEDAIAKMNDAEWFDDTAPEWSLDPTPAPKPKSLLATLGLGQPIITRRS